MGLLAVGQTIGHLALSIAPGHHHPVAGSGMLAAHLVAIPVGATVIRAAETGMRRAITSVCRFVLAWVAPMPAHGPARIVTTEDRIAVRRLLVSSGIGRRGPPGRAGLLLTHPAPA